MNDEEMKVLLLSTGESIGGEEIFTRDLALELQNLGYQVSVAPGSPVQRRDLELNGIKVENLDIISRSPVGIIRAARRVGRFVRDQGIEVVHCQAAGPAVIGGINRWMNWSNGTMWLYQGHGIRKRTYRWLPLFLNRLDYSLAVSDYEMIQFIGKGVRRDRITRVHNGIDPDRYSFDPKERESHRKSIRHEFHIPDQSFTFGYVGRLSPEKGCDLLLPAFVKMMDRIPDARLLIVGEGLTRTSLEAEISSSGLENRVTLTGFREDIPEVLCGMDVLLSPSYKETFSLTNLQAMAAGLPIIASDVCGNPEQVIPGYTGALFESGSAEALSEEMIKMFLSTDRAKKGSRGRELVCSYFNKKRMMEEILSYYSKKQIG